MKKIAIILALLMAMTMLCACGDGSEEPAATAPQTEAPAETEPEEEPVEPPIEIEEFGNYDDMPAPTDSGEIPAEFTSDDFTVTVGDKSYNLQWLYEHSIYDWRLAGITFDQIEEKSDAILDIEFSSDAYAKMKQKISDFVMITMLDPGADLSSAPVITVGDKEFDVEWLASHNATEYTAENIDAATVKQYLDSMSETLWYTREYRWISVVYDRLVNGWK